MALNFTASSGITDAVLGINLLAGSLVKDTVGIFDQSSLQQVFINARPVKAIVKETSRVMEHPVETGAVLADHHIINPKEIEFSLMIGAEFYSEVYQQIRNAFINATKLMAQTRTGVYRNMIVMNMPHQEEPDMYDSIMLSLQLREVLFVVPNSIASQSQPADYLPANPTQANTALRGLQSKLVTLTSSALSYIHLPTVWGM
jgi:hypothetical protein